MIVFPTLMYHLISFTFVPFLCKNPDLSFLSSSRSLDKFFSPKCMDSTWRFLPASCSFKNNIWIQNSPMGNHCATVGLARHETFLSNFKLFIVLKNCFLHIKMIKKILLLNHLIIWYIILSIASWNIYEDNDAAQLFHIVSTKRKIHISISVITTKLSCCKFPIIKLSEKLRWMLDFLPSKLKRWLKNMFCELVRTTVIHLTRFEFLCIHFGRFPSLIVNFISLRDLIICDKN